MYYYQLESVHPVEYSDMSEYDYQLGHLPSGVQSYVCVRLSAWTFTQWSTATGLRTTISLDIKGFMSKRAVLKIDLLYARPEHFVFTFCLAPVEYSGRVAYHYQLGQLPSGIQWEGCVPLSES